VENHSFLSVRIPDAKKRLVKEIAARNRMSIQELVGSLVDDFIEKEERANPSLAETIKILRKQKGFLKKLGVAHLDLFGSLTRSEAGKDSDIDIAVEFNNKANMTLSRFASLRADISRMLNRNIDLSDRRKLSPDVKRGYDRDAIRVF